MILQMTRPVQGGLRQERKLEATSNHLSNSETAGFKKDVVSFDRMFKAQLNTDFSQGHMRRTDNKLDLALGDEGFFKVNTPDGIRYTRDGNFTLSSEGILINQEGFPVQGDNGDITINGENIQINKAGNITVDGVAVDVLDIVTFEDVQKLDKQGADLFVYKGDPDEDEQEPARISVKQGALEGSNVQVVDEMVTMIDHHRMYETFQKMMLTFDEVDGKAITEVGRPQ
ncbi:flagellar hook-basal body protein [Desulfamplus magnetovallimortis]|nr:flagellar hook-basal body protein [Desulfamplus magnetovallimortis]